NWRAAGQGKGRGVIDAWRESRQSGAQHRCLFYKAETASVAPPDRVGHEIARWDRRKRQAGIEQERRLPVEPLLQQTRDQSAHVAANTPLPVGTLEGTCIQ